MERADSIIFWVIFATIESIVSKNMREKCLLKVVFLSLLIVQSSCVNHKNGSANTNLDSIRNALDVNPESVLQRVESLQTERKGYSEQEKHDLDVLYVSA